MEILRSGSNGSLVRSWQQFLLDQGFSLAVDGIFGPQTVQATVAFQKAHNLVPSGIVGHQTYDRAISLGFGGTDATGPVCPPSVKPLSSSEREILFGKFEYVAAPTPSNPEAIRILDSWESDNIVAVSIPQLIGVPGAPRNGVVRFHRKVAAEVQQLFLHWAALGLMRHILSWDGSFVPRFKRGTTQLSNHSYGTAFDVNARFNPLGAEPALRNTPGSLRDLVLPAIEYGLYWGGFFHRPDAMHFEAFQIREDTLDKA